MWKRGVEKPVEIVEKCEFSTAISDVSQFLEHENPGNFQGEQENRRNII